MNNKRTLVIPVVAILAVIISVATSLAYNRSTGRTSLIPVTGRSNSDSSQFYQIARQHLSANNGVTNQWDSSVEQVIRRQQSMPAYVDGKTTWRNSAEEFIRGHQPLPAYSDSKALWRNSVEEYIRGQSVQTTNSGGQ